MQIASPTPTQAVVTWLLVATMTLPIACLLASMLSRPRTYQSPETSPITAKLLRWIWRQSLLLSVGVSTATALLAQWVPVASAHRWAFVAVVVPWLFLAKPKA
jgi:hypothetical protein